MREQPEGLMLLQLAVTTLREQLLPTLPAEHKYTVLMIANAISIAGRQLKADDDLLERGRTLLEGVLRQSQGGVADERLARLERRFALGVRFGAADHDLRWQEALWSMTVLRVRESVPRYLESECVE